MPLPMELHWDSNRQTVQWRVTYTDRIADWAIVRIIMLVNPSVIFNIWLGAWL
jgi:hypothetical protein